jgi:hypothetical protein
MEYSQWDIQANRYLGRFEDERQALELVRTLVNHYGPDYAEILDLGFASDTVDEVEPLSGAALLARVDEVLGDPMKERRGMLVASRVSTRLGIEPIAAVADRAKRWVAAAEQRRMQRS